MKVCFHHQDFDVDVSSGTSHALYQWHVLFYAFGVDEVAVINHTDDPLPYMGEIVATSYETLEDFVAACDGATLTFVEEGGSDFRNFDFSETDWLVFGGTGGLPRSDVGIDTKVALYPREAAAIILAGASWQ